MKNIKLGIIREGKVPPDFRVPLTPKQCKKIQTLYSSIEIFVQSSPIRAFKDEEYLAEGIKVVDDLSQCDIIIGVKEVPIEHLIANKTYIFFSHTIKKQAYNKKLLQTILDKKIELIDYELIKDKYNNRLIGFGRYAGIVGCYNGFRTYGLKHQLFELKPAHQCVNRKEMEDEMKKIVLPDNFKVVITGFGRVGHGAVEIINMLPITEVSPEEMLSKEFTFPVFSHLTAEDYYARIDGKEYDKKEFYTQPELYKSTFSRYLNVVDMYIPCHFWNPKSSPIIINDDLLSENRKTNVIADISCDVNGPIASTIRSSEISNPIYGYNPLTQKEDDFMKKEVIAVMAVDNLPCELPLDASEDFGNELIKHVIPALINEDHDKIIYRATETTKNGELSPLYEFLADFVNS